jgi:peptidoglycan hydrolase CwlO-like protein
MRKKMLFAAVAVSLFVVAAPAAAQDASVNAEPQATAGDNVTVESVEIDDDGWVAVYPESVDGGPDFDDLKGAAEVEQGGNDDILIETDGLEQNDFYYAVLHYEEEGAGEFSYPEDTEVTYNDSTVQDDFYVAVGTQDVLGSYAEANQQRRDFRNRIDSLQDRLDELERRSERASGADSDLQDQIDTVSDELESTQDSLDSIDSTIQETESLLEEVSNQSETDGSDGDGNGGADEGNGTGNNTSDDGAEEPQGLPGFTALGALVAGLTAAVFLNRRD